jgi:hypothetical protein
MPVYSASQLLNKTLKVARPLSFYRVIDINNLGNNAKPVSNKLPVNYQFVVDSFLLPTAGGPGNYGIVYAPRSATYFTFKGRDGGYYAVKNERGAFNKEALSQQGILTVEDEIKLYQEQTKDPLDKIFEGFGKFAGFAKWMAIGVAAIWATGYLIKTTRK